jgi:hypothetical protein
MLLSSANETGTEVLFMILDHLYIIRKTEDPGQSLVLHCHEF